MTSAGLMLLVLLAGNVAADEVDLRAGALDVVEALFVTRDEARVQALLADPVVGLHSEENRQYFVHNVRKDRRNLVTVQFFGEKQAGQAFVMTRLAVFRLIDPEVMGKLLDRFPEQKKAIDADGDGTIDLAEWEAMAKAQVEQGILTKGWPVFAEKIKGGIGFVVISADPEDPRAIAETWGVIRNVDGAAKLVLIDDGK